MSDMSVNTLRPAIRLTGCSSAKLFQNAFSLRTRVFEFSELFFYSEMDIEISRVTVREVDTHGDARSDAFVGLIAIVVCHDYSSEMIKITQNYR